MTAIDVATRFPRSTLREAYERSKQQEKWVFDNVICSSLTLLYGQSGSGKSFLMSSMLLSLMTPDRDFLGMQPTDPTKVWKPIILATDPASDEEYGERWFDFLPELDGLVDIPVRQIGRTIREDEWQALTDSVLADGHNIVILDNLMGVTGDTNNSEYLTTVFDGLNRLVSRSIPVIVLHHETEKYVSKPGAAPMGNSLIVQKPRMWIQVRQTNRRGLRGGNTQLIIQGNKLVQALEIVAEPQHGPAFTVKTPLRPWGEKKQPDEAPGDGEDFVRIAEWVVANCQGVGRNEVAKKLVEKFGRSEAGWKDQLTRGTLSKLLLRDGQGEGTVWRRKVVGAAA